MIPEHELRYMYYDKGMTQLEIAELCGVNDRTVSRWMVEQGIGSRTNSESKLGRSHIVDQLKLSKEELGQMYWDKGMSQREIAKEIGVGYKVISRWMQEHGIGLRSRSDFVGEINGNWHGGISFEPYCKRFNILFKESVRERDDYTCQLCGCEQNGRKLDVHHIHYDKENCYPDVVALCRSCNSRVNANRDYWEQYFENQLLERGLINLSI